MIRFNPESSSSAEKQPPTREETLAALKAIGRDPEEAERIFLLWLTHRQKEMDESESWNSRLIYNIEAAELLLEAELFSMAEGYHIAATEILHNEFSNGIGYVRDVEEFRGLIARLREIYDQLNQQ